MKYKDAIKQSMDELASDPRTVFIGYNVTHGSRAYGTLNDIPADKCIETPVAENLMADMAIGMAIEGYRPVVFFERHDFVLNALDALVNHLDKLENLSGGEFTAPVIVRAVIGGTKPLYPGLQHTQNFTDVFQRLFHFPVYELKEAHEISTRYREAMTSNEPVLMVEEKDKYESDC
jgi:pyruvate dehydrogenase E1 component beta subunit